jgi:hypothetical protein
MFVERPIVAAVMHGAGAFEADHGRTVPQNSNPSWKWMTGSRGGDAQKSGVWPTFGSHTAGKTQQNCTSQVSRSQSAIRAGVPANAEVTGATTRRNYLKSNGLGGHRLVQSDSGGHFLSSPQHRRIFGAWGRQVTQAMQFRTRLLR